MRDLPPLPGADTETLTCYRHPGRETLVRCATCGRPICTSCMVQTPVGIKCPECAGRATGVDRLRPHAIPRGTTYVTYTLIALNVLVFLIQLAQAGGNDVVNTQIAQDYALQGHAVAGGDWYRIVTGAFLHANFLHILFNMYALWVLGVAFESYVGPLRMALVYFASVLCGSAGALLLSGPNALTVGASGGIFGVMTAVFVLERQRGFSLLMGGVGVWLLLNLVITFAFSGISVGGHLGGIVGGGLAALILSGFGKGHMAAGKLGPAVVLPMALLYVGAIAVALAAA
ncbi:MAG TPA: rhomboid family intramembrane serine protease [Miltoncostaeaceae bacterium]|nr:rhomboid family intramembrane serine protease [Miltoncostaeaceae bacterium]